MSCSRGARNSVRDVVGVAHHPDGFEVNADSVSHENAYAATSSQCDTLKAGRAANRARECRLAVAPYSNSIDSASTPDAPRAAAAGVPAHDDRGVGSKAKRRAGGARRPRAAPPMRERFGRTTGTSPRRRCLGRCPWSHKSRQGCVHVSAKARPAQPDSLRRRSVALTQRRIGADSTLLRRTRDSRRQARDLLNVRFRRRTCWSGVACWSPCRGSWGRAGWSASCNHLRKDRPAGTTCTLRGAGPRP